LKDRLRASKKVVDKAYQPLGGSFEKPYNINICDACPYEDIVISEEFPLLKARCIRVPVSYCREVKCSAGITVVCRARERLLELGSTSQAKVLDLILPMLYFGSFAKFYFVGKQLISEMHVESLTNNLTVTVLQKMKDKFGTWSGGPDHRSHFTPLDLIAIYSDKEIHKKAIKAIQDFCDYLETKPKMDLVQYKVLLLETVHFLPGIDLSSGQNLGLYLALCGYMKRNLHNAFLSFPVAGSSSSETINKENSILETELVANENTFRFEGPMAEEMKKSLHFKANPEDFSKTVRIVSTYAGFESRPYWVERIFSEVLGPKKTNDWLFKEQSMFWIFKEKNRYGVDSYVAKEKKANGTFYLNVVAD
jgi:hypothetical protein